jgi:hypothetical protein
MRRPIGPLASQPAHRSAIAAKYTVSDIPCDAGAGARDRVAREQQTLLDPPLPDVLESDQREHPRVEVEYRPSGSRQGRLDPLARRIRRRRYRKAGSNQLGLQRHVELRVSIGRELSEPRRQEVDRLRVMIEDRQRGREQQRRLRAFGRR